VGKAGKAVHEWIASAVDRIFEGSRSEHGRLDFRWAPDDRREKLHIGHGQLHLQHFAVELDESLVGQLDLLGLSPVVAVDGDVLSPDHMAYFQKVIGQEIIQMMLRPTSVLAQNDRQLYQEVSRLMVYRGDV
jgi:hypothetical protein